MKDIDKLRNINVDFETQNKNIYQLINRLENGEKFLRDKVNDHE